MSFSKFQRSRPALYRGQLPSGFSVLRRPCPQPCITGPAYYKETIHWSQSWERSYLVRQAHHFRPLIGCQAHPRSESTISEPLAHLDMSLKPHLESAHFSPWKGKRLCLANWRASRLMRSATVFKLFFFYKGSSRTASVWFARTAILTTVLWGKLIYVWKSMREAQFQTFKETQKVLSEKGVEPQRIWDLLAKDIISH